MTLSSDEDVLIRGDAAARARPIDLTAANGGLAVLTPVGPWSELADETHANARRDGYAKGLLEGRDVGRRASIEEVKRRNAEMTGAVERMIAGFEHRTEDLGRHLGSETVELALEIAAVILGREVRVAEDPGAEAIARCLEVGPAVGDLVARLHPDDAARLGELIPRTDRRLTVVADPGLEPGDAIVMINDTSIDGRLSESLKRVAEVLR